MMDITYYIYLGVLTMAVLTAIVSLKKGISFPVRIISLLVLYTGVVEWSVFYKAEFCSDKTNVQMYNFFHLVQYLAFAYYFQQIIQLRFVQKIIQGFLYLYPIFWYVLVFFVFKLNEWNSYVFVSGGMFILFFSVVYCYELLSAEEPIMLRNCSEFWIAIGLIFFYVCGVPYMGMYRFLTANYADLAKILKIPLQISNIVMYSLFTYAFICQLTITKRS
ncbi:hypothetical protein [Sphingobacterium corticibacterium]|uniref:Uncharacterized protein n=1 Tax=Sphingobacterium corticibacterium TaxID=2484746 RepID=A0A4Q6XYG0_9SPHI|nr:hypothetical protein [Sphingobacterium corticibacterium]RZF62484.1 hypothetical protein EWE74_06700 [Sphingobacterium corticibacterium]